MPGYCGQLSIVRLLLSLALISLIPCGMSPIALTHRNASKIRFSSFYINSGLEMAKWVKWFEVEATPNVLISTH